MDVLHGTRSYLQQQVIVVTITICYRMSIIIKKKTPQTKEKLRM